jgi:hypothetical protein
MSISNLQLTNKLQNQFTEQHLHRPWRTTRYDDSAQLEYEITSIINSQKANIKLQVEKFVGGGFAGQVYKVKVVDIQTYAEFPDLEIGKSYAVKILVPPSRFSQLFRNAVYWLGFGAPFQLQVNPAASKAGAIWQKFFRRAAKIKFGSEESIVDIYATFIDSNIGSCGEISEWIEGRNWQLEVDERMDLLSKWRWKKKFQHPELGSVEFRTKHKFMEDFVNLLHEMGGHEFARQYEWTTLKSQPNCLKRMKYEESSEQGLVAVDFRAGLALLPLLPMSPGDFKLIFKGLSRGSLVQFDRGSLKKLEKYVEKHKEHFSDMLPLLHELRQLEDIYRNSTIDITHNHVRLLYSKKLWSTMLSSCRVGLKTQNLIDEKAEKKLHNSFLLFFIFLISLIPILGNFVIKLLCNSKWRNHYFSLFKPSYFGKAVSGIAAEKALNWFRQGRISEQKTEKIATSKVSFLFHLLVSILPIGFHKFVTDKVYFKERLFFIFVRPIRLYFDTELREKWLYDMVEEGKKKRLLSIADAEVIYARIKEPFIQKYLKSLAVHVCTVPITQLVSVFIAIYYVSIHPEFSTAQAWGAALGIIALFQVVPISPGSLVRGLYVLYLVIKERDFKNYNIAVFLGFFKYVGYLAFPIQMTYRYPVLARFMACHWATEAVHIIPVFGEHGALLEHWVYELFYNWPLTIRRKMNLRKAYRETIKSRVWHVPFFTIFSALLFIGIDFYYLQSREILPQLREIGWFVFFIPFLGGMFITGLAGGMSGGKRTMFAAFNGIFTAIFYSLFQYFYFDDIVMKELLIGFTWRFFLFGLISVIGCVIFELNLSESKHAK